MKKRLLVYACLFFGGLFFLTSGTVGTASASQLVFQFQNPSFPGGNPFTGTFLLNSAQAQNKFKEEREPWPKKTSLEQFNEILNRQILHRLAYRLVEAAFGEEDLQPGHYQIGDTMVDITTDTEGITVHIVDTATGGETIVQVPYY